MTHQVVILEVKINCSSNNSSSNLITRVQLSRSRNLWDKILILITTTTIALSLTRIHLISQCIVAILCNNYSKLHHPIEMLQSINTKIPCKTKTTITHHHQLTINSNIILINLNFPKIQLLIKDLAHKLTTFQLLPPLLPTTSQWLKLPRNLI